MGIPTSVVAFQGGALAFNFGSALATIVANKYALRRFPFPAALTALHYLASLVCVYLLLALGVFERGRVALEQRRLFASLVVAWAVCNALSNASLGANSVGFYQLMKVLTTPVVVLIDFLWHGKRVSSGRACLLALACAGIALATVSDVQFNARGASLALASVGTGIVQKTLNEHLQQRGGLSTLQLMHLAFPWMSLLGVLLVPLMDAPGLLGTLQHQLTPELVASLSWSALAAVAINVSTTLVLGVTSALSLILLGQTKTCAVMLAGVLIFDAPPNGMATLGAALAVGCIGWYTTLKLCDRPSRDQGGEEERAPLAPAVAT